MRCIICYLLLPPNWTRPPRAADFVVNGQSVCTDHVGDVRYPYEGNELADSLDATIRRLKTAQREAQREASAAVLRPVADEGAA